LLVPLIQHASAFAASIAPSAEDKLSLRACLPRADFVNVDAMHDVGNHIIIGTDDLYRELHTQQTPYCARKFPKPGG
jgi:hypothetical protein